MATSFDWRCEHVNKRMKRAFAFRPNFDGNSHLKSLRTDGRTHEGTRNRLGEVVEI